MQSIITRRLIAVGVTAFAVAVSGAPAAHAASKAEKKQNSAIKKAAKAGKTAGTKAGQASLAADKAAAAATDALNAAATADKKGSDAGTAAAAVKATVDAIIAQVPTITGALQKLADGLTAAGAGLTKLGDFVGADEYGIVQIAYGTAPGTAIPGCFYETGNIPDNVQDAIVTGTCLIPNPAAGPPVVAGPAVGDAVHILAGIRSNEVDGVAGGNAAGVAGIVSYSQTGVNAGTGAVTALGGGATIPAGAGLPPAVTIPLESAPTSTTETSFPFAPISTDNLVDLATTQFSGTPAPPVFGNPATTPNRAITFTIRFNDLTSAADNPKE